MMHLTAIDFVGRLFVQVYILDRIVDQIAQCCQRFTSAQRGPSGHVRPWWWQVTRRRSDHAFPALARVDLADASAVHAEISSDVMLPIATRDHSLHDCDLAVIQRHIRPHSWIGSKVATSWARSPRVCRA